MPECGAEQVVITQNKGKNIAGRVGACVMDVEFERDPWNARFLDEIKEHRPYNPMFPGGRLAADRYLLMMVVRCKIRGGSKVQSYMIEKRLDRVRFEGFKVRTPSGLRIIRFRKKAGKCLLRKPKRLTLLTFKPDVKMADLWGTAISCSQHVSLTG